METFRSYTEARAAADSKLKGLHKGDQSSALTPKEVSDALSIRESLQTFYQDTGRKLSALEVVTRHLAALGLLPENTTVEEACRAFSKTIPVVTAKPIADAVAEFIQSRQSKEPKPGERARFSPVYQRNVESWLTKFSEMFPSHLVSDLTADFLEKYMGQFYELSPKARNDRRGAIGMWLRWCGRKDFIEAHSLEKLLQCDVMQKENIVTGTIAFYTPAELEKILLAAMGMGDAEKIEAILAATNEASRPALCAVTALQAFGGARLEEALRLRWEDLNRNGHVEISGLQAKTRKRRLLEVGPALAAWLALFKDKQGPIWSQPLNSFITEWARMREAVGVASKKNGVRHGFVSFSYVLRGEVETAILAGTSPTILHANYRGLASKPEAKKWFAIRPPKAAKNIIHLPAKATA